MSRDGPLTYQQYLSSFPIPDPESLVYYQDGDIVLSYVNFHEFYSMENGIVVTKRRGGG